LNLSTAADKALPDVADKQTDVVTFLLQFGLAELWKSWGVEPDSLMGFGVGQYTAAHLAGVLSPEDALQLVVRRAEIRERFGDRIFTHGPEGESDPKLNDALDEFEALADAFNCFPPDRTLICSLTAECVPVHRQLGGSYWRRHCVESPQVHKGWQQLVTLADDVVMDFSTADSADSLIGKVQETSHLPALLRCIADDTPASEQQLACLAELYVRGTKVDFRSFYRAGNFRKLSLPTYPYQKQRYWITDLNRTADDEPRVEVTRD
jgi:acyl transferase domain-containing protein